LLLILIQAISNSSPIVVKRKQTIIETINTYFMMA